MNLILSEKTKICPCCKQELDQLQTSVIGTNPQDNSDITLYVDHKLLFNKLIWSIDDVALFTRLSRGTIYNKTYKGDIPYRKRGNRLYFNPQDILNWIDEGDL